MLCYRRSLPKDTWPVVWMEAEIQPTLYSSSWGPVRLPASRGSAFSNLHKVTLCASRVLQMDHIRDLIKWNPFLERTKLQIRMG